MGIPEHSQSVVIYAFISDYPIEEGAHTAGIQTDPSFRNFSLKQVRHYKQIISTNTLYRNHRLERLEKLYKYRKSAFYGFHNINVSSPDPRD